MANRVGQWGGSLSVRLPKNVVEALSIKKGDGLRIFVGPDHTIHIRPVKPVPTDGTPAMVAAPAVPEEPTQW